MTRNPLRSIVIALALVASALAMTAPAQSAAKSPALRISDTRPLAGERVTVRADLPGKFARPLRLQAKSGARWRTVETKRSTRAVRARFTYTVPRRSRTPLRVVAPRVRHRGIWHRARTTRAVAIRPRSQTLRLGMEPRVTAHTVVRAAVVASPPRPGRTIGLERLTGGRWTRVGSTRVDTSGQAGFTFRATGSATYRAVALAFRGAAAVVSPPMRLTVDPTTPEPTPEPTPGPLGERCDLPVGGTVHWGNGAALEPDTAVARVDVTTDDGLPVESRTEYSAATITVRGADDLGQDLRGRVRVRGNSTSWVSLKYPYKVKLDAKASILGMPKSKDWVLLANFYDRSLLRGDVAFEAARRLEMAWVPRMRPAEVWVNGTYYGLYQIGEGIEAESSRVDLQGGAVLLEADRWEDTDPVFTTPQGLQVHVKSTEDAAAAQRAQARVGRAEDVLYSADFADGGYRTCLDVDSFVDAYLLAELTKNIDAGFNNSVWMVLGDDGRVAMGPPWDFDHSAGNRTDCLLDDPTGWFIARNWFTSPDPATPDCRPSQLRGPDGHWYQRLLADPSFAQRVRDRWAQVRESLAGLPEHIDRQASVISEAAGLTFTPRSGGGAGIPLGPTFLEGDGHVFRGSWSAEAEALSDWYSARVAWLDEQFSE